MNGPARARGAGVDVETVDMTVERQDEEKVAGPDDGLVVCRADLDWDVEEGAVGVAVHPDGVLVPRPGGDEGSVG